MVNEFGCAWILATFGFVQQCIKIIAKIRFQIDNYVNIKIHFY